MQSGSRDGKSDAEKFVGAKAEWKRQNALPYGIEALPLTGGSTARIVLQSH